jgi:hypothetical protein
MAMNSFETLLVLAFLSLAVLALVLLVVEVDITQTRRIEKQVARDVRRIRIKTIKGWPEERIAERYPHLPMEQIRAVRRAMARHMAASEEVEQLRALWSIDSPEPGYEA